MSETLKSLLVTKIVFTSVMGIYEKFYVPYKSTTKRENVLTSSTLTLPVCCSTSYKNKTKD
jgi:hypothetical protein